jgi:glycopeptide antibiotics resistance protein
VRAIYGAAALVFASFAVWGSLFPFDLRPLPTADVLALFWSAWRTGPASWSRSDFASNVILFIPIGLFACAALDTKSGARGRRFAATPLRRSLKLTPLARAAPARSVPFATWPHRRTWSVLAVLLFAILLSSSLEFAQALVPSRTSSIVDVLAETLGASAGLMIWRIASRHIDASLAAARRVVQHASSADRALLAYAALFGIAWLLPFDFTLRPNEIADKFEHKRLLLPFTPSPDAISPAMLMLTCAASIPIGIVALRFAARTRHPLASAMLLTLPALLVLEAGQVLVFSRTTDATALLAAIAGVFAGAGAARLARSETAALRSGTTS